MSGGGTSVGGWHVNGGGMSVGGDMFSGRGGMFSGGVAHPWGVDFGPSLVDGQWGEHPLGGVNTKGLVAHETPSAPIYTASRFFQRQLSVYSLRRGEPSDKTLYLNVLLLVEGPNGNAISFVLCYFLPYLFVLG